MREGDILAGKYELGRQIGAGGMSTVVEATDMTLGRPVAIKFVRASANGVSEERLRREAVAVAQFQSEHIVRVYETGVTETGGLFIAMERLRGFDVATQIRDYGNIPVEEAVSYTLQVCEALAHAHAARIVHRDIKPSNMFVVTGQNGRRTIKLLDFGIALNRGLRKNSSLTRDTLLGTPHFMSPEQIREPKAVDARADIWAVGVSLFQMLSGQLPFQSPKLAELIMSVCEADAPSLASINVTVPRGLEGCIRTCLQKNPEDRYPTVKELASVLLPYGPLDTGRILYDGISNILVAVGVTLDANAEPVASHIPTTERVSHHPDTFEESDTDADGADRAPPNVHSVLPTLLLEDDPEEPPTAPTERGKRAIPEPSATRPAHPVIEPRTTVSAPPPSLRASQPPSADAFATGGPVVTTKGPVLAQKRLNAGHVALGAGGVAIVTALLFVGLQGKRDAARPTSSSPVTAATVAASTSPIPSLSPPAATAPDAPAAVTTSTSLSSAPPAISSTAHPPGATSTKGVARPTSSPVAAVVPVATPSPPAKASAAVVPVVPLPPELQGRQ